MRYVIAWAKRQTPVARARPGTPPRSNPARQAIEDLDLVREGGVVISIGRPDQVAAPERR
jgi:hypothetical protein